MRKSRKPVPKEAPKKEKRSFRQKVSDSMDFPLETLYNLSQIQITGNREAIVEGCKGILEYDDCMIRLKTKSMQISFWGSGLVLKCLNTDNVIIEGQLERLEFII